MSKNTTKLNIGLYEKALPIAFSWEQKIKEVKSLGFDFLEISIDETEEKRRRLDWPDSEIDDLSKRCYQHDIFIQSICLSAHRKYPFGSTHPEIRQEAKVILLKALKVAQRLGVRTIQLAGYDVYYEEATQESHLRFIEGMQWSAKQAEKFGIMLAVEIMDTNYLNSLSKFEILKRQIPSPYFMAYPDVGNINGWNYDVCTELELSQDHIVQIHLKETLKVTPESSGKFRDLVIGEGQVDFDAIFNTLNKINYAAPVVIEMWAKDENWKNDILKAKEILSLAAGKHGFKLFAN